MSHDLGNGRNGETISCLNYCQFYGKTRFCSDDIAHSFVPNVLNCSRFAAPCNSTTISVTYKVVTLKFIVVGGMVLSFPCPFHFVEIFHLNILFISWVWLVIFYLNFPPKFQKKHFNTPLHNLKHLRMRKLHLFLHTIYKFPDMISTWNLWGYSLINEVGPWFFQLSHMTFSKTYSGL